MKKTYIRPEVLSVDLHTEASLLVASPKWDKGNTADGGDEAVSYTEEESWDKAPWEE